jgi:hypothetical protein
MVEPIYAVIEDFYNEEELKLIWRELEFLTYKMQIPERTGTAVDAESRKLLKKAKGIFLNQVFSNPNMSDIYGVSTKITSTNLIEKLTSKNPIYRSIESCSMSTLINYYENSEYYKSHKDISVFTAITYFFKEPKKFDGGNLILSDFNIEIEIKNNMLVIFPGCYMHEVPEIKMNDKDLKQGLGRYSIAHFLSIPLTPPQIVNN